MADAAGARRRGRRAAALAMAVAVVVSGAVVAVPASADTVDRATARDALNAACAASQQAIGSGLVMSDGLQPGRFGRYDAVTGAVERTDRAVVRQTVYTRTPSVRYERVAPGDAFATRALARLGSTATWVRYSVTTADVEDAIPSPGSILRDLLATAGTGPFTSATCADSLTQAPRASLATVERTVQGDLTQWRLFVLPRFFGAPADAAATVLVVHVTAAGVIVRLDHSTVFEDGIGGLVQSLTWQYDVRPTITVPNAPEVVAGDDYLGARSSFVAADVRALAARVARKRLANPTVRNLRSRVVGVAVDTALDPELPSGFDRVRGGAVVWQERLPDRTYVAYRFSLTASGRTVFRRLPGFAPSGGQQGNAR